MNTNIVPHAAESEPRGRVIAFPTHRIATDESPDEAFSTAYFRASLRGESLDFPAVFDGLGGGDAA